MNDLSLLLYTEIPLSRKDAQYTEQVNRLVHILGMLYIFDKWLMFCFFSPLRHIHIIDSTMSLRVLPNDL